jgi:hypothetical protein
MIFHLFAQLYQFNAQPTSSNKAQSGVLKDGEHLVHYILAKPLHTDVGSMGIPAFDQGKVLVSHDIFWMLCGTIDVQNKVDRTYEHLPNWL